MESFETRLESLELGDKTEFSINEFATIAGLSRVWVRRAITKGKKPATKRQTRTRGENVVPKWFIAYDDARVWYEEVRQKQADKVERYLNPKAYSQRRRPSEMSHRMTSRKVEADTMLTDEQRELFQDRLDAYREAARKDYAERQKS